MCVHVCTCTWLHVNLMYASSIWCVVFIGFQWMLQQTTDFEYDNESDEEMVVGLQIQTLPVTEDVDDNRGGKV